MKPNKGVIKHWSLRHRGDGICVIGLIDGHPEFHNETIRTSNLVSLKFDGKSVEAETQNSIYQLEDMA